MGLFVGNQRKQLRELRKQTRMQTHQHRVVMDQAAYQERLVWLAEQERHDRWQAEQDRVARVLLARWQEQTG